MRGYSYEGVYSSLQGNTALLSLTSVAKYSADIDCSIRGQRHCAKSTSELGGAT